MRAEIHENDMMNKSDSVGLYDAVRRLIKPSYSVWCNLAFFVGSVLRQYRATTSRRLVTEKAITFFSAEHDTLKIRKSVYWKTSWKMFRVGEYIYRLAIRGFIFILNFSFSISQQYITWRHIFHVIFTVNYVKFQFEKHDFCRTSIYKLTLDTIYSCFN